MLKHFLLLTPEGQICMYNKPHCSEFAPSLSQNQASSRRAPLIGLVSLLSIASLTHAADGTWNSSTTGNWSDTTKWLIATPADGVGATANFSAFNLTSSPTVSIDTTSRTLGALLIGDTNATNSYAIAASGGGILTFDNGGSGASLSQTSTSLATTISAPIVLADNLSISNAAGNALTISGTIGSTTTGTKTITSTTGLVNLTGVISNATGAVAVVQNGSGILGLSGNNTFSGGVTIKQGTVIVSGNNAALGTGPVLLGDSLVNADASLLSGSFTIANNITVQPVSSGTSTIGATGNSAVRLTGNLTLDDDLTFSVVGGAQGSRNTGAYLNHATGTITGAGGINLDVDGNVSTTNNNGLPVMDSLSLGAVATSGAINNVGSGTGRVGITGNITAAASINQNSASSVLSLGGASTTNSYSGATNVNAGVLRIVGNGAALSTTSAVTVANGASLNMAGVTGTAASLSIAGHGSSTATGALVGTNNSGYSGTVTLTDDATISSDLTGAGTTFTLSSANSVTGTNKTLTVTGIDHTTISGTITTGSGSLIKLGEGRLTLSGSNTFTGLTQINRGLINLNNANALGGGGNITFGGGALQYASSNTTDFGSRIVNSTAPIAIDTNTFARTLSGVVSSNTEGLTKLGSGTLTLSGTNAYTGIAAVNAGVLGASVASALPGSVFIDTNGALNSGGAFADVTTWLGSGKIANDSTGAIALTGNSAESISLSGFGNLSLGASVNSTYSGTLSPAGTAYRLGGGGAILTLSGANALTGPRTLAVNGAVTLTGSNDLSGATTVAYNSAGTNTLTLSGANGNLASSAITLAPTATLAIVSDTTTTAATRASSVTMNRGNLNVTGNSSANTTDAITGALTVGADGLSTVTVTPGNKNALLTAGSYVHNAGGTVLFRGTALGSNTILSKAATSTNIQFSTPNLVGNDGTGTDRSIFVGALGATATNGSGFGANGGLLTQDATNGVRILSGADYKTTITDGQTTLDNVQLTSTGTTASVAVNSATTINSLSLNSTTAAGANVQVSGSGTLTLNSGVIYANSATATTSSGISNAIDFNGREGIILTGGTASLTLSGVLGNTGGNGLTVYAPSRSVTFSGTAANTFTGTTTVNGGSLLLQKTGVNAIVGDIIINAGGSITENSNQVADTANLTLNGGTFTGANDTLNNLNINNGGFFNLVNPSAGNPGLAFVIAGNATVSGYGNNSASVLSSGARGNVITVAGNLNLSEGGRLIVNSSQNVAGNIDGSVTVGGLNITNRASGAYTAVTISPNGSQNSTQKGGQFILNGDVTFTGNASNANTVFIDAATGQGPRGNVALRGASAGDRTFNIGDGAAANDLTIAASLVDGTGGASGLIKAGSGTMSLNGASTYTGSTQVTQGTLTAGVATSAFGNNSAVVVSTGATLDISGAGMNQTIGSLASSGTGTTNLGANTLTTGGDNSSTSFGGTLSGTGGSLAKVGTGTQTLSGTNTYTGSTTVTAGTLLVSGTINNSSGVAVNGGTLNYTNNSTALNRNVTVAGGDFKYNSTQAYAGALTFTSGTVSGSGNMSGTSFIIGAGRTLSPGNSPGTLSTGAETWLDNGSYNFQIADADGAAGAGYDTVAITGGLDLNGLSAGGFDINLWTLASTGPDVNGDALDFNPLSDFSWTLASTTSGITGFNAGDFDIFTSANNGAAGFSNSFGGTFAVNTLGNDLILTYTAVPEPSSCLLLGLGIGAVLLLRRRNRLVA